MSAAECGHEDVDLPDPLPEVIAAAMNLRVDPRRGFDVRRLGQRIAWAVRVHDMIGRDRESWSAATACAVLQRHPDLVHLRPMCGLARQWRDRPPDRTELGYAERIAVVSAGNLAWPAPGGFGVWDGSRWKSDETGDEAAEHAKAVARELLPAELWWARFMADRETDDKSNEYKTAQVELKAAAAFAKTAQSARVIRNALDLIRGEPGVHVEPDVWDTRPRLLPVDNGTLELLDGDAKLREHAREDRLTRIARARYLPGVDGGEWDRFVREVLPDPQVCARAQKLAGASLVGGNPARLLVMLVGKTTTGKSTFVEALTHALGEYGGPFELSMFRGNREGSGHRSDLIAALPRRIVATTEASDRWEIHADAVKRLTGADTLAPRAAYAKTAVEQRPQFTPWIATNAAPRVVGADDALWRRLEVIPFTSKIAREDPDLAARLRDDHADAVLTWMVQGWIAYSREGLGPVPAACQVAAAQLRADMSLIDTWIAECCEIDPDATERPQRIADSWQGWCTAQHVPERERISSVALGKELTARGYVLGLAGDRGDRYRARRGLRIVEHAPLRAVQ